METCTICARRVLGGEHERCERCVMAANRRAVILRYTLEELAAELGEDASTVALWERGAEIPDEPLDYLSGKFGVSADFIAGTVS